MSLSTDAFQEGRKHFAEVDAVNHFYKSGVKGRRAEINLLCKEEYHSICMRLLHNKGALEVNSNAFVRYDAFVAKRITTMSQWKALQPRYSMEENGKTVTWPIGFAK